MNALDTNVLVYAIDRRDAVKWRKARALVRSLRGGADPTVLPWQVLGEFVRFLRAWEDQGQLSRASWLRYLGLFRATFPVVMPTPGVLDRAIDLSGRFSLSHWDSMLLGACIEAGVDTLYSEDMGSPATIDGLKLVNPFV